MEFYLDKPDKEMGMEVGGRKEEFEFELCRFHLRRGAKLRDTYTCFQDMITEYDTVNLIHGDWGGAAGACYGICQGGAGTKACIG